jgi:hypothetical protein
MRFRMRDRLQVKTSADERYFVGRSFYPGTVTQRIRTRPFRSWPRAMLSVTFRQRISHEPKRGNIPLSVAIAQRVNRTMLDVLTSDPERLTKNAVRSDNTQVLIEDKKGNMDRVHNSLGERVPIIDIDDLDSSTVPYLTITKSDQLVPATFREAMNVMTANRGSQVNSLFGDESLSPGRRLCKIAHSAAFTGRPE